MLVDQSFSKEFPKYSRIATVQLNTEISVIEVGYNRLPGGMRQMFNRDVYVLHYVTNGNGTYLNNSFSKDKGYLVVPKELEIVTSNEDSPFECSWIMFQGRLVKEFLNKCGLPHHNRVFSFNKIAECDKIIKEALFCNSVANELDEFCLLQSTFYKIMALHMQNASPGQITSDSIPERIKDFIEKNYYKNIKIDELANHFNYTRNYIYTLFKRNFGVSPQEYLLNFRIEKARQLLSDKNVNLPIHEIAIMSGFDDPLYFSKYFRKKIGISPSQFKKKTDTN